MRKILELTLESDKVLGKEIREKPGHDKYAGTEIRPQLNEKGMHVSKYFEG